MTSHSTVGASVIKRRKICPASRRLEAGVPNRSSKFADEGTLGHALGEACLLDTLPAQAFVDQEFTYEDHGVQKKALITQEMADYVQVYVDAVLERAPEGCDLLVEHKFHLKLVHDDLFGTSDAVVWNPVTKTLHTMDLKYGAGVPVEVADNMQLQYYAVGALLETGYPANQVEMVIVQPRCPHPDGAVRSVMIDAIDLIDFAEELKEIVKATEDENAPIVPSEECRFCSAAGICPGLATKAQEVAKEEFRADLSYDADKLAETLRWLPILEGWCASVREFAYGEAEHGRTPPGFKLVEKRATRRWRDEENARFNLIKKLGMSVGDITKSALLSPAAIEKLLPKDQRSLLEELCIKESSGLALAPQEDRRPAVKLDAKSEFSNA